MKVDLIRKFKWYIVGFIMCVIMLAVGLSFCAWDDMSITALAAKANTGGFDTMYKLGTQTNDDKNNNGMADVGDVVTFGKYYLDAPQVSGEQTVLPDKTSLRWIVVEKQGTTLTLLTESVIAFGSFWGTFCYDANGNGKWHSTDVSYSFYQNYERSTARAWLNSYSNLRNDGGTNFTKNSVGVFQGFYDIAFDENEQNYIIAQDITGMRGAIRGSGELPKIDYDPIYGDKVWLPSYSQVTGVNPSYFSTHDCSDGIQYPISNSQFSYFTTTEHRIGTATAFATTPSSNYTYMGETLGAKSYQFLSANDNAYWMLRSPYPITTTMSENLCVNVNGTTMAYPTDNSSTGVRPAVCIPL